MHKLVLNDDRGRQYIVQDPERFFNHLINFHTKNQLPDNSIHEEKGFYFTVTSELFIFVQEFVLNMKK